ncbi:MAG: hypothetical protein RBU29_16410, partial [bacterium]|jgi:hypothetical protein|nr:hypothetical protein [bacterium]
VAFAAEEPYSVGETWAYAHEGAVPMRAPDFTVVGERVREVVAVKGEGDEKRWMVQEKWGAEDDRASQRAINAERLVDRIVAENGQVAIKPAYPYDFLDLKVDEEKGYESTFSFGENWTIPLKLKVKRGKDESIQVPAGEYADCTKLEFEEQVTFTPQNGNAVTIVTKRQVWLHASVNGMVKEISTIQGPDGEGRTGTSVLKKYSKEKSQS